MKQPAPASQRVPQLATPVLVVALWLVWSTAFVAIKVGLRHSDPATFTLIRVGTALAALLVVVLVQRGLGRLRDRRLHMFGLTLGAVNVVGFLVFQNLGLTEAPVGVGAVLIYTMPFWVALGAWQFLSERLTALQVVGMVTGWLGVVIVVAGELDLGATPVYAVVFLLLSALCWAIGTVLFKRVPSDIGLFDLLLVMNAYAVVPIVALAVAAPGHLDWGWTLAVTGLWAGAGASVGGLGLQFALLRRGKAGVVSTWIFAVPVLAAALGVLFLDETAHFALLLGGMAVAAGIYVVNRFGESKSADQGPTDVRE
jgi:drug/metabolite transporter (DMT)-like permease